MSAIPAREMHASRNYEYTDAQTLSIVLCSALKKMKKNLRFYRSRPFVFFRAQLHRIIRRKLGMEKHINNDNN
jgi:gluconate kinase